MERLFYTVQKITLKACYFLLCLYVCARVCMWACVYLKLFLTDRIRSGWLRALLSQYPKESTFPLDKE